ncbi:ABC transporter ATP-binding protein [Leifsonia xyli subsp. cynodontis DSM 46306]|uniref:Uncharacterized protein n=1 Tax=Leifsonia xyli subsp. cynodontis DSM 46306 TaxID=1389489 RepID=U3PEH9_LEIXC|nr:ABC transporter ATP-binding protein [Leifsonia xyli subsp. cynodontis DSM 46306]
MMRRVTKFRPGLETRTSSAAVILMRVLLAARRSARGSIRVDRSRWSPVRPPRASRTARARAAGVAASRTVAMREAAPGSFAPGPVRWPAQAASTPS